MQELKRNYYSTTDIELAAFLLAKTQVLKDRQWRGNVLEFIFIPEAAEYAKEYSGGAAVSALELFWAYRTLQQMIQDLRADRGVR